ncbi:MAG TPA: APC family permease [Sandaracinaceae bacterium LLY-WYZ-13_1]|nr:APC family permease [Sandaracinaceae bacterium LLY-WYZ-13_1]
MTEEDRGEPLRRTLSAWDVVSLGLNGVIGSGIFLLPGSAARRMGPAALVPLLFAGALCFVIALCYAEVGSRFSATGGAYLYARRSFGGFVGFSVGWMVWWVRVISGAALANAFAVVALEPFDPAAWLDEAVAAAVLVGLALPNLLGAKAGAWVTNAMTVAKLLPLLLFVGAGAFVASGDAFAPFAPRGWSPFADTTLLLLWAFVGFEMLAVPAGEMRDPVRAVPRALGLVMGLVTGLYAAVFAVALGTHPSLAGSENPVAEAAPTFLGPVGGAIVAIGIAASVLGTNAGSALVTPRCLYALAEQRQIPPLFARVHPRFATPWVAIAVSTALSLALALSGTFEQLAVIAVVARFVQYLSTCVALLVLRRRERRDEAPPARLRLPGGPVVALLALGLSLALVSQAEPVQLFAGAAAWISGVPFFLWFRRRRSA